MSAKSRAQSATTAKEQARMIKHQADKWKRQAFCQGTQIDTTEGQHWVATMRDKQPAPTVLDLRGNASSIASVTGRLQKPRIPNRGYSERAKQLEPATDYAIADEGQQYWYVSTERALRNVLPPSQFMSAGDGQQVPFVRSKLVLGSGLSAISEDSGERSWAILGGESQDPLTFTEDASDMEEVD